MNKLLRFLEKDLRGQGLVEYMLVLVLVAVLMVFILTAIGQNLNNTYAVINSNLP